MVQVCDVRDVALVKRRDKRASESYWGGAEAVYMNARSGKHEVRLVSDRHVHGGQSCVVIPQHEHGQMGKNGLVGNNCGVPGAISGQWG